MKIKEQTSIECRHCPLHMVRYNVLRNTKLLNIIQGNISLAVRGCLEL